jgi:hypothetical protein
MNEEQLKKIAEEFKATLSLEELDELEREYNAMYKKLKEKEKAKLMEEAYKKRNRLLYIHIYIKII